MFKCSDTVSFRSYLNFYDALGETGRTIGEPNESVFCSEAPFASVKSETWGLFGMIDLTIVEMLPAMNIDVCYEMGFEFFAIGYVLRGSPDLSIKGYSEDMTLSNRLYIPPPSGSEGRIKYYGGRPVKTLSFYCPRAAREIIDAILGEEGGELWSEAVAQKRGGRKFNPVTSPPPDVANAFFRIAHCNYPDRVKRIFFENTLREILIHVIAYELPAEVETRAGMDEFEVERIKSVPRILTERLDSLPTIQELARELSMSATKLKRGFKKIFGKPIYAYHRDICLERAAIMLLDTNRRVCEIASDAGYSVSCNFSNAFKKHYGVSPGQYRKKGGLL